MIGRTYKRFGLIHAFRNWMVALRSSAYFEASYRLLSVEEPLRWNPKITECLSIKGNLHFIDLLCKETGNVPTQPSFALKWIKIYYSAKWLAPRCLQQWTSHTCALSHFLHHRSVECKYTSTPCKRKYMNIVKLK